MLRAIRAQYEGRALDENGACPAKLRRPAECASTESGHPPPRGPSSLSSTVPPSPRQRQSAGASSRPPEIAQWSRAPS